MLRRGALPYASLKRNAQKLLRLNGKLHGELVNHFLGVTVYNKVYGALNGDAALLAVEELVLRDF